MEDVAVKISGLKKTVDDFQLGPVHLEFEPGTITALVGKNGAGKSTFAKLLMNLARRDEGDILIQGRTVSSSNEDWKTSIAYQPQTLLGCDVFTGKELMKLVSNLYPKWDTALFSHLVKAFDIPLDKPYGKLSQGVQQKLNFAITLPRDTDILLLDEPTAHMDIPSKQILIEELVKWMDRGEKTMILVSHQIEDIRKLADYIVVFHGGNIIGKTSKDDLTEGYKRYWMEVPLPSQSIPGEIARKNEKIIVSNQPESTEAYFNQTQMKWMTAEPLELEEIISLMMKEQ